MRNFQPRKCVSRHSGKQLDQDNGQDRNQYTVEKIFSDLSCVERIHIVAVQEFLRHCPDIGIEFRKRLK